MFTYPLAPPAAPCPSLWEVGSLCVAGMECPIGKVISLVPLGKVGRPSSAVCDNLASSSSTGLWLVPITCFLSSFKERPDWG